MSGTDFWWLSPSQKVEYIYVELGHHRPVRGDEQPCSIKWDTETCLIEQTNDWRVRFKNTNVYRSLRITTSGSGGQELIGPFLVDIDNDNGDLGDALAVARRTFHFLQNPLGVGVNNLKIFFTGHKGFNLEISPNALDVQGSIQNQLGRSADILNQIIEALKSGTSWQTINQVSDAGTVIDRIYGNTYSGYRLKHPYVRLHNSLNKWIMSDGKPKARMKIELTSDELSKLSAKEIVARSENLAI